MSRIIRALIASGMLLALSSRACGAQSAGFDLAWNDCIGLPSAAQNIDYACDDSRAENPFKLVITFTVSWDLPQFVGTQVLMDVRTGSSQLPDWWRLAVGECREGGIAYPGSRTGIGTGATGACVDPWASAGTTGGGYLWESDMGAGCGGMAGCGTGIRPGSGVLRIALARDSETPLQAGQRYLLAPILLYPDVFAGESSCPGCDGSACLFIHQVELYQIAGQVPPQQDIYVLRRPVERAFVTWQGGQIGSECSNAVPVKRATWGAIKAIYR